jgi:hypothetical protein
MARRNNGKQLLLGSNNNGKSCGFLCGLVQHNNKEVLPLSPGVINMERLNAGEGQQQIYCTELKQFR